MKAALRIRTFYFYSVRLWTDCRTMSGMYLCALETRMKRGLISLSSSTTRHQETNWCLFMVPMNLTHRCDLFFPVACELSCERVLKGHSAVRFLVFLYQSSCCATLKYLSFLRVYGPFFYCCDGSERTHDSVNCVHNSVQACHGAVTHPIATQ